MTPTDDAADRRVPPRRRRSDPPAKIARWDIALEPWRNVILFVIAACTLLGVIGGGLMFMGVVVRGPGDEVAALRAEIAAERREREQFDSASARDRAEIRAMQMDAQRLDMETLFAVCSLMPAERARQNYACRRVQSAVQPMSFAPAPTEDAVRRDTPAPQMPTVPPSENLPLAVALPAGKRWPWPLGVFALPPFSEV